MDSQNYDIRTPNAADREQWEPLWQSYLCFYQSRLPEETTDLLWQRILDPEHEIECRLAMQKDTQALIGLVHFFPHAHTWQSSPVCYLNDLFVSPEVRGGGVGKALIETVVSEARQRGWAEVYWMTQENNTVARGLYDKLTGGNDGFVSYVIDTSH